MDHLSNFVPICSHSKIFGKLYSLKFTFLQQLHYNNFSKVSSIGTMWGISMMLLFLSTEMT